MKIKKLLALVLTVAMVVSMLVMPVAAAELSDISGHWANDSIERWVDAGVIGGYPDGTFKPDGSITRAEFATILAKAFGLTGKGNKSFSDVDSHWAKDFIYACAAAGIVGGYPDGSFQPDKAITRQEAMKMYTVGLGLYAYVEAEDYVPFLKDHFTDANDVGEWAQEYAVAMVDNNAMQGSVKDGGVYLNPTANITRAEVTVILDRIVAAYVSAKGEVSPTTQAQIDKGMMGNRVVVHPAVDAKVRGAGNGCFKVYGEGNSAVELDEIYEVCVILNGKSRWIYDEEACDITGGELLYYYRYALPTEDIQKSITYHDDGTVSEYERSTVYLYDDETWRLEKVLEYEDDVLVREGVCEFDEENRPSKVYVNDTISMAWTYNEKGYLETESSYDSNGKERHRYAYTYDEQGRYSAGTYTYFYYWYEDQYDENGDLIVDDEGNPVQVEIKDEDVETFKYGYDKFGNEVSYQAFGEDGQLSYERLNTFDENGELLKMHYKNYHRIYHGDDLAERYLGHEEIYIYENGREKSYEWITYEQNGEVDTYEKRLRYFDEEGRMTKREEYYLNAETGKTELVGTLYVEFDKETGRETAEYYKNSDGFEVWKHVYKYEETEDGYISTDLVYEEGVLQGYNVTEYKYETHERWEEEYDADENLIYKGYSYTEYDDDGYHRHSEYQFSEDEKYENENHYVYILLPETYETDDWYYYY